MAKKWAEMTDAERQRALDYQKKYNEEHKEKIQKYRHDRHQRIKVTDKYRSQRKAIRQKYYSKTAFAPNHRKRWEGYEDMLVYEHTITDSELSEMIGRSVKAIQIRRHILKNKLLYTE